MLRSISSAQYTHQEKTKNRHRIILFSSTIEEEFNDRFGDTFSDPVSTHFIKEKAVGGFVRVTVTAVNSSLL